MASEQDLHTLLDQAIKRFDATVLQIDRFARQLAALIAEEDRIKEDIAQLFVNVRNDMHSADRAIIQKQWSIEDRLNDIDNARQAGQWKAQAYRYLMLIGIGIIITILLLR